MQKVDSKQSTKKCPACGNEQLLLVSTQNKKYCTDCSKEIPWYIEDKQKRLYD